MLSEIHELIVNAKLLKPGKIIKLSFINSANDEYRVAAGIVKSVVKDGNVTTVKFKDFIDTYHDDGWQNDKEFVFENRYCIDDFTGKWNYKIVIHNGTEETLKKVAKKFIGNEQDWINDWKKEADELKADLDNHKAWIRDKKKVIASIAKKFKISSEKSK